MTQPRLTLLIALLVGTALAEGVLLAVIRFRDPKRAYASSSFNRGREVATRMGCFNCHGPDGRQGTATFNPTPDEIPGWEPATFERFVRDPQELRQWILDGLPARLRADPAEVARVKQQAIRMPAYRASLGESELRDLLDYVATIGGLSAPSVGTAASRGYILASTSGCFGCHGAGGRSVAPNAGSLKGYIPAWDSEEFVELVRDPAELREWISDGRPRRLREDPLAALFLDTQKTTMPAYRAHLSAEQIDDLATYVSWARSEHRGQRSQAWLSVKEDK